MLIQIIAIEQSFINTCHLDFIGTSEAVAQLVRQQQPNIDDDARHDVIKKIPPDEHSNSSIRSRGLDDDKTRMSNGTGSDRKPPIIINTSCESFSHVKSTNRIWLAWFYIWQLFIHKKKKKSDISTSIAGTQVTSGCTLVMA